MKHFALTLLLIIMLSACTAQAPVQPAIQPVIIQPTVFQQILMVPTATQSPSATPEIANLVAERSVPPTLAVSEVLVTQMPDESTDLIADQPVLTENGVDFSGARVQTMGFLKTGLFMITVYVPKEPIGDYHATVGGTEFKLDRFEPYPNFLYFYGPPPDSGQKVQVVVYSSNTNNPLFNADIRVPAKPLVIVPADTSGNNSAGSGSSSGSSGGGKKPPHGPRGACSKCH